jgi:hypothetical protein
VQNRHRSQSRYQHRNQPAHVAAFPVRLPQLFLPLRSRYPAAAGSVQRWWEAPSSKCQTPKCKGKRPAGEPQRLEGREGRHEEAWPQKGAEVAKIRGNDQAQEAQIQAKSAASPSGNCVPLVAKGFLALVPKLLAWERTRHETLLRERVPVVGTRRNAKQSLAASAFPNWEFGNEGKPAKVKGRNSSCLPWRALRLGVRLRISCLSGGSPGKGESIRLPGTGGEVVAAFGGESAARWHRRSMMG